MIVRMWQDKLLSLSFKYFSILQDHGNDHDKGSEEKRKKKEIENEAEGKKRMKEIKKIKEW